MGELNHIGFTGTRKGMGAEQRAALKMNLEALDALCLHHGDCIGADEQAHNIAFKLGYRTWAHPANNDKWRAFCPTTHAEDEKPPLERNRFIVQKVDLLIAAPLGEEKRRSGTWATVRYAREKRTPIIIIEPDGRCLFERGFLPKDR